jgi:hypothetical protein
VFASGVLMVVVGLVMVAGGTAIPTDAAKPGLILGGLGVGLGGLLLTYLGAPGRRDKPPPGTETAKAAILDASGTTGSVAGYQMIELTLEVRPKGGVPFQVKRKFSAGRLGRVEAGHEIEVVYDPANPERVELA